MRSVRGRVAAGLAGLVVVAGSLVAIGVAPAGATTVTDEASFRAAWTNPAETEIDLANDITFTTPSCTLGTALRSSTTALTVNGNGHTLTLCTNTGTGVLEQNSTGALTFQNITVTGGTATSVGGGAIFTNGAVTVTNSTFTNNTTAPGGVGGAIAAVVAVTVTNSTFTNNTSGGGGAIAAGGAVTVTNSTFTNNTGGAGGAISDGTAMLLVTNSTFTNNTATAGGGAIGGEGAVTVTNSTFTNNNAPGDDGGAIQGFGAVTVTNSTFTNNTAGNGGAIAGVEDRVTVAYSTLTGNVAPTGSALVGRLGTSITLFGSVFVKPGGTGPLCAGVSSSSLGYNYANETANSCHLTTTGDSSLDANDPLLGALANNGGPTQTRLPQDGPSPLIDAIPNAHCGDGNSLAGFTITTDQRGLPRPDAASPNCDIGAVEVQSAAPVVTAAFTG